MRAQAQTLRARMLRAAVALVAVVALGVGLTGCGGSGRFAQLLQPGVQNADSLFTGYADDLGRLAQQSEVPVPTQLDDAVRQTRSELADGATLTDEEAQLLARG